MPPKVIRLHGHHHWNEHVRDTGRCRFAKFLKRNIRDNAALEQDKAYYTKYVYTKYYELTVIDLWNFIRNKANNVV